MVPRPAFLQNQIIVLVIAHPDDEAIFFGPVLQEITKPEHHNRVIYLCLSTGDIDGQGQVREEEIHQSAAVYGIQETDIHVVDDPKLKDGAEWEKNDIVDVLRDSRLLHSVTIITFDEDGATGHTNHKSLLPGIMSFLQEISSPTIRLYSLKTVSGWHGWLHLFANEVARYLWGSKEDQAGKRFCVNNLFQIRRAWSAANKHVSQQRNILTKRWFLMNMNPYFVGNLVIQVPVQRITSR